MAKYNVAIFGATGLAGLELIRVLKENLFPIKNLFLFASSRKKMILDGEEYEVRSIDEAETEEVDIAFFATDINISKEFVPKFVSAGIFVIDKSRAFRYDPYIPLVIPEINGELVQPGKMLIANPNCTTTQLAITLAPIRNLAKIEKVVATSLQSISGAGIKALNYFEGKTEENPHPFEIRKNIIPFIGNIDNENYCDEENTIIIEINKIFNDTIELSISTLRVPVAYSHSISTWVKVREPVSIEDIKRAFISFPGLKYSDNPPPMPIYLRQEDLVFVGRLKMDKYDNTAFSFFSVTDNLRKGAATNAYQIASLAHQRGVIRIRD